MYKTEIDSFKAKTILVIGDAILDHYTTGTVNRTSPEGPIPVVHVQEETYIPGGAANVACNVTSLGAKAIFCSSIGNDVDGQNLSKALVARGVDVRGLCQDDRLRTIRKNRIIAQNQQLLRIDFEDSNYIYDEALLIERLNSLAGEADLIILSDYRKGLVTQALCDALAKWQAEGTPVIIDAKPDNASLYPPVTLVKPNCKEAYAIAGIDANEDAEVVGAALLEKFKSNVLITLGSEGMLLTPIDGEQTRIPTRAREVYDVTGAGDTVIATLGLALAAHMPLFDAVNLANHAAGVVVAHVGCAAISPRELILAFDEEDNKIKSREDLVVEVKNLKSRGRTIATLNGCFDIMHPGHIHIISEAKKQADILVVALNTDDSIRKNKGPHRPINNQDMRATVMAALQGVDYVTFFSEETPDALLETIVPDVHINDASYGTECIEAPTLKKIGTRLHMVDKLICPSTTDTIAKIKLSLQDD